MKTTDDTSLDAHYSDFFAAGCWVGISDLDVADEVPADLVWTRVEIPPDLVHRDGLVYDTAPAPGRTYLRTTGMGGRVTYAWR